MCSAVNRVNRLPIASRSLIARRERFMRVLEWRENILQRISSKRPLHLVLPPLKPGSSILYSSVRLNVERLTEYISLRRERSAFSVPWAVRKPTLKKEIALREGKDARGFASNQPVVHAYFVSLRVNFDVRCCAVVHHVVLSNAAALAHRADHLFQSELCRNSGSHRSLRNKCKRRRASCRTETPEHRPVQYRLRRRDGRVRVSHCAPCDEPALHHHFRLRSEESRLPQHQVRKLPRLDRTNFRSHAVSDRGVDGVLGNIALHSLIIVARRISAERATLYFHFVRGLPGAQHHFAHAPHGLRIARNHADHAHIVQNILRRNRLRANPALR